MSRYLIRLLGAAPPVDDVVPDAELLRRFSAGDAAAFELLVRRHANAVWAACVRILRNDADADDAFQTTFLVLAKKAGSVRGPSAGAWLHRVAVNAALKLKAKTSPPSTRNSHGSPNATACQSCCATWKGSPAPRRRGRWGGRSGA